jgi:pimeloyl-ACP methyl ester carboxylesterase
LLCIEFSEKPTEYRHNTATLLHQQGGHQGYSLGVSFVDIVWRHRPVRVEYQWLAPERVAAPLLVFLHEGLGSLSMWKDFPQRVCDAAACRGLVYSRPGYGRSTPRAEDEEWLPDFMHQQAFEVLPAVLQALRVQDPPWLFGHSDGGSIALLHAARFVAQVAGVVVMAPHIFVEDLSVASIERTRLAYVQTDLRSKLARHHDDPDSAFWGWNGIWLNPKFRDWSISEDIKTIRCPLLAMQGLDDEYGTLAQVHGIQERLPHTQLLELAACGHSPHRDQADAVIHATVQFMQAHTANGHVS